MTCLLWCQRHSERARKLLTHASATGGSNYRVIRARCVETGFSHEMISADHNYFGSLSIRLTCIRKYRKNTSSIMRRKIRPFSYAYVHGVETETLHEDTMRKKARHMTEDSGTAGREETGQNLGARHKEG